MLKHILSSVPANLKCQDNVTIELLGNNDTKICGQCTEERDDGFVIDNNLLVKFKKELRAEKEKQLVNIMKFIMCIFCISIILITTIDGWVIFSTRTLHGLRGFSALCLYRFFDNYAEYRIWVNIVQYYCEKRKNTLNVSCLDLCDNVDKYLTHREANHICIEKIIQYVEAINDNKFDIENFLLNNPFTAKTIRILWHEYDNNWIFFNNVSENVTDLIRQYKKEKQIYIDKKREHDNSKAKIELGSFLFLGFPGLLLAGTFYPNNYNYKIDEDYCLVKYKIETEFKQTFSRVLKFLHDNE
jgi:hypothetical protein